LIFPSCSMGLNVALLLLLMASASHTFPLHITIEGGQAIVVLYYGNGTFLTINGNTTVYLPNQSVQAEVVSFQPFSTVLINGLARQNITFFPETMNSINVTLVPTSYTLTINVVGNGTVKVKFQNSTSAIVTSRVSFKVRGGEIVYLSALALPGNVLRGWSDNVSSQERWILMYNNTNLTAVFVKAPPHKDIQDLNLAGVGLLLTVGGIYWIFRRK